MESPRFGCKLQPHPLAVCASELVSLCRSQGSLKDLADELSILAQARERTAESISALCEVSIGEVSAPEALKRLSDYGPASPAIATAPLFDLSVSPIDETSCLSNDESKSRQTKKRWTSPAIPKYTAFFPRNDESPRSPASFQLQSEVIIRLRGALERSLRDPREVFYRFCRQDEDHLMGKTDLLRVAQSFDTELATFGLMDELWRDLGKNSERDTLTYDEFRKSFGPCVSQPPVSPSTPSVTGESPLRQMTGARSDGDMSFDSPSSSPTYKDDGGTQAERTASEERRARVLLYRLGRALLRDTSGQLKKELSSLGARSHKHKASSKNVSPSMQEVLDICGQYRVQIARSELASLLWLHSSSGALKQDVIDESLRLAENPPAEVSWAQKAIASAGLAARAAGEPLAVDMASLGNAADADGLRAMLSKHTNLDDEQWETLLVTLDKRADGKILMEPLAQWAVGIGLIDVGQKSQVVSVQDMFDSPRKSQTSSPPSELSEEEVEQDITTTFLPVNQQPLFPKKGRAPIKPRRKLSCVEEGGEEDGDSVAGERRGSTESKKSSRGSIVEPILEANEPSSEESEDDPFGPISVSFGA